VKLEILSKNYNHPFGLPRYNDSLKKSLSNAGIEYSLVVPTIPPALSVATPLFSFLGLDLRAFFTNFPVSAQFTRDSVKHFTNHTLATMIGIQNLQNTIVTVHDIFPDWLIYKESYTGYRYLVYWFFHKLSMRGLRRADVLITDTQHVKEHLVYSSGIARDRIFIIPLGIDHSVFKPINVPEDFKSQFGLNNDHLCILHIGTDAPRKNLPNLIRALAIVREKLPNVKLIKVGKPSWIVEFQKVQALILELGLDQHVQFIDWVSDEDLSKLYNSTNVVVYPSFYEGFGLPILEAMACGTPVITSNTSCLPEVAGGSAILIDPHNVDELAQAIYRSLVDMDIRNELREKGLQRAKQFSWESTTKKTIDVYTSMFNRT
jgi:glycosyltransferase involved in cell wall biosynthesis